MTPTDRAFLDAICAAPDDDAPRLVYADYLDEQGQADRAEFIRLQCALARHPACEWRDRDGYPCPQYNAERVRSYRMQLFCPSCARAEDLRRRERQLFEALGANPFAEGFDIVCTVGLEGDIPLQSPTPPFVVVHRGFAEEITMDLRGWLALWQGLRAAAPLRVVRLVGGAVTREDFIEGRVTALDFMAHPMTPLRRLCAPLGPEEDSIRGLDTLDISRANSLEYNLLHAIMRDSYRPWRGLRRLVLPNWVQLENRYYGHEAEKWGRWVPGLLEVAFGSRVVKLDERGHVAPEDLVDPPPRNALRAD